MDDLEMEDMRAIALRSQSGSQLALLRRARPLSGAQIVQVGELMANMMAGYPHQALEMAAEVYQMAFEDLARLHGLKNLETALRGFLTSRRFFPHPSEVREVLDEMATKAKKEAMNSLPKLGCDECEGQCLDLIGFVMETRPGQGRAVVPCKCRIRRDAAKKAMATA